MTNTVFYTDASHGQPRDDNWICHQDGNFVFAKSQHGTDGIKYFIKTDASHKLYNPFSIYNDKIGIDINQHTKFLNKICKTNNHKYIRVHQKCFEAYLTYLKTKNISWLLKAQREIE